MNSTENYQVNKPEEVKPERKKEKFFKARERMNDVFSSINDNAEVIDNLIEKNKK